MDERRQQAMDILIDAIEEFIDVGRDLEGPIGEALQSVIAAALQAATLDELMAEIEVRREHMLAELGTNQEAALIAALETR